MTKAFSILVHVHVGAFMGWFFLSMMYRLMYGVWCTGWCMMYRLVYGVQAGVWCIGWCMVYRLVYGV